MSRPKILVRECPECRQLHMTNDASGETPCDACAKTSEVEETPVQSPPSSEEETTFDESVQEPPQSEPSPHSEG